MIESTRLNQYEEIGPTKSIKDVIKKKQFEDRLINIGIYYNIRITNNNFECAFFNLYDNNNLDKETKLEILESTFYRTTYKIKEFIKWIIFKTRAIWIYFGCINKCLKNCDNYNAFDNTNRIIRNSMAKAKKSIRKNE